MKHYIDSYDIKQHNKILAESVSSTPSDKCELLYRLVEEKKNFDTDMAFFKECSKSSANTNLWLETCLDIMQARPNAVLLSYFKENILPLAGIQYVSKTINSNIYDEDTTIMLNQYYNLTLAKEQVQNFHEAVMKFDDKLEDVVNEHYDFYRDGLESFRFENKKISDNATVIQIFKGTRGGYGLKKSPTPPLE